MIYRSGYEWYMNKPLCVTHQNIDSDWTRTVSATEAENSDFLRRQPLNIWNVDTAGAFLTNICWHGKSPDSMPEGALFPIVSVFLQQEVNWLINIFCQAIIAKITRCLANLSFCYHEFLMTSEGLLSQTGQSSSSFWCSNAPCGPKQEMVCFSSYPWVSS